MKIASENTKVYHSFDVMKKLKELEEKYRTIYWTHIDDELYVYVPIGRKDYKDICSSDKDDEDKKDMILNKCIILPEDFDAADEIAGVVEVLYENVINVSYLDSQESVYGVIGYYREDMFGFDNQITCIINEAFPQFDIEEIENWDVERTAKYLSRAEWKLQNLRGAVFNEEYFNAMTVQEEQTSEPIEKKVEEETDQKDNKNKKKKLTPEELRKLQQQFPEIRWEDDAILKGGIDAMADSVDTTAPALRPGMF